MKMTAAQAAMMRCPSPLFSCHGPACPVWRWVDHEYGYCGFGGEPRDRPEAPDETPKMPEGEVAPKEIQPVPDRVKRPVHGPTKRTR